MISLYFGLHSSDYFKFQLLFIVMMINSDGFENAIAFGGWVSFSRPLLYA